MDINTKTQQVNIFAKGMNSDISDALLERDQYRLANNMRYVTDDQENTGEMHVIEGAENVIEKIDGVVRGMISIRNYGVIITEDEPDGTWHVYRWDSDEEGDLVEVASINNRPLSKTNKLSLVTKYEDDKNIKVYIADGEYPIRVINIMSDEKITDYNRITSYPNITLPPPNFEQLINGTLKEGVVQYSYQLYNIWGTATDASIPTKLIPLHNKDVNLTNTSNFKGVEQGKTSNKGVRINITIPDGFTRIKIFRITYVEAGQPPLIELIIDTDVSATNYVLDDTGYEALQTYSLEEYNGIAGIHIIPRVIEAKDEYMFAAAIKTEQSEFDDLFEPEQFQAPQTDVNVYELDKPYIPSNNNIEYSSSNSWIKWNFVSNQQLIIDENGTNKELIKLPTGLGKGYNDPQMVYQYTSLRRDELYRFGIILYNNLGGHSSVFWIADIRTPSTYSDYYKSFYVDENGVLIAKPLGIHIEIDSNAIHNYIKSKNKNYDVEAFEIVRCNRTEKDIATIAQGVLARPGRAVDTKSFTRYPLSPTGWVTTANYLSEGYTYSDDNRLFFYSNILGSLDDYISNRIYGDIKDIPSLTNNSNTYQFICPEMAYQKESFKDLIDQDDFYLRALKYLYGRRFDNVKIPEERSFGIYYVAKESDDEAGWHRAIIRPYDTNIQSNIWGNFGHIYPGNEYTHVAYSDNLVGAGSTVIHENPFMQNYDRYVKTNYTQVNRDDGVDKFDNIYNTPDRHQYIKLYHNTESVCIASGLDSKIDLKDTENISVRETNFADALNWDDFAEADDTKYSPKYMDRIVNIGEDSYTNWVATCLYGISILNSADFFGLDTDYLTDPAISAYGATLGPGGRTGLIQVEFPEDGNHKEAPIFTTSYDYNTVGDATKKEAMLDSMLGTYLCNLRKNVTPYGGDNDEARKLSTYYSYGEYIPAKNEHGEYINTRDDVYIGDCFIQPFEYVSMHKYYHPKLVRPRNACMIYSIPVETNINLAYTYGYEFSKKFSKYGYATNLQDQPNDVNGIFIQDEPLYAYNATYSSSNKLKLYAVYQDDPTNITNEDYRCYYSNPKNNNESVDNWTIYQPANFIDVDTRKGAITGLRTFHNALVFWQKEATGLFSVNERTTITDESNMPLLLGTGGVLARYDYIATSNGMKENEFADTQSDSTLYWWDHNKADICAYAGGQEMMVLSKVKSVSNFINKQEKLGKLKQDPALTFDKRYNEMIASVTNGDGEESGSMVYSEQTQQFVGLYDINHIYNLLFADKLYLLQDPQSGLFRWNTTNDDKSKGIVINNGKQKELTPYLKYVINENPQINKVYDIVTFGARIYGGGHMEDDYRNKDVLNDVQFDFSTPLKQRSHTNPGDIENVEYDFRFVVPRNNDDEYGGRMRGKTMQCEFKSKNNSLDLSIQYITTKYRISWS